jgi:hypothetical protein
LTRSSPFVLIALPFAAGIWLASAFPMPAAVPALAFVTVALAALGAVWLRSATSSAWLAACAALLCLGALHYTLRAPLPAARSVAATTASGCAWKALLPMSLMCGQPTPTCA